MLNKPSSKKLLGVSLMTMSLMAWVPSARAATYYVDNPRDYGSGDCNSDLESLGDDTSSLRSGLNGLGWTGQYWSKDNAWPIDLIDCTKGGDDCHQADTANLAVFNGHGNVDDLAFSHSAWGVCDAGVWDPMGATSNIAIGLPSGVGKASMMIAATCCYMRIDTVSAIATFGGTQILGFGGVSSFDSGMVGNFFSSSFVNNSRAWVTQMEDKPGWFTGDNTTVAVTRGWNMTDANNNKNNCGLKRRTCWQGTMYGNGPTIAWVREYIDHGHGGC